MKRILSLMLVFVLLLCAFAACEEEKDESSQSSQNSQSTQSTQNDSNNDSSDVSSAAPSEDENSNDASNGVSSAAPSEDDNSNDDSSDVSNDTSNEPFFTEPEIKPAPTSSEKVTEDEWNAAFAKENFVNVTIVSYRDGDKTVNKADGTNSYYFGGNAMAVAGEVYNHSETYAYLENDGVYEVTVYYNFDKQIKHTTKEKSTRYTGAPALALAEDAAELAVLLNYAEYAYDEEKQAYVGGKTFCDMAMQEQPEISEMWIEVYFENGRLAKYAMCGVINGETVEVSQVYYDYGTTVIDFSAIEQYMN